MISMRRMRKRRDHYSVFLVEGEVLKLDKIFRDCDGIVDLSTLSLYGNRVFGEVVEKMRRLYPEIKGFRVSKMYLEGSDIDLSSPEITETNHEPDYLFCEFAFNR